MSTRVKTLRRRLFGSHLSVIAVALGVLLVVVAILAGLFEVFGGQLFGGKDDTGDRGQGGPFGLIFGLLAAVTASALVSWQTTKRLAAPLEEISAATRELAAGRYDARVPSTDTVELNALADDVNQLAGELKATEQRRLRLIGDVAHELRNPLSTIEGTMEGLLDGVVDAEPGTYARIAREAARLRRLADDLSSLSSAGELQVVFQDGIDMAELAANVVAQLEPQATAKGLQLRFAAADANAEAGSDGVPTSTLVAGDRDRLTQVLINVVGNALQYTDQGQVTVRVTPTGSGTVVEVIDTGRGLGVDDQSAVFERFYRVDQHFTDGTGVGLAIAKLIVEAHGGYISATSEGLGHGSTFRIELPGQPVTPSNYSK